MRRRPAVERRGGRVERHVERIVGGVGRIEVFPPVVVRIPLHRPVEHPGGKLLLRVRNARRRRAVRGVLLVVARVAAIAHERVRPRVEALVGAVRDAEGEIVVVELDHEVRARVVERHGHVARKRRARHRRVGQIRHIRDVGLPRVRGRHVRERIRRRRLEPAPLEVEAQRLAHRVRRHVVAVPPRVRVHQLHAHVLARHARRVVRRHRRAQLHPLVRTLRLPNPHEVVRTARRHNVFRRIVRGKRRR